MLPRPDNTQVEVAGNRAAELGEGAIWHTGRGSLFWVDITGRKLFEYLPSSDSNRVWEFDLPVSTVVPETDSTVVVALQNRIERIYPASGRCETLAPVNDRGGSLRTNDGKCDPAGRLWFGTMAYDGTPGAAALYSLDSTGIPRVKIDSISISNGIVWTQDHKTMYYIDTPTRQVKRYRYDEVSGDITFDGVAVTVPDNWGFPDGMTIDNEGKLWIAHWGGWGVYRWDPETGKLLKRIAVPTPCVTSCAFGGPDFGSLYITTAGGGNTTDPEHPLAGSLFVCQPGAYGVEAYRFGEKN